MRLVALTEWMSSEWEVIVGPLLQINKSLQNHCLKSMITQSTEFIEKQLSTIFVVFFWGFLKPENSFGELVFEIFISARNDILILQLSVLVLRGERFCSKFSLTYGYIQKRQMQKVIIFHSRWSPCLAYLHNRCIPFL